jgi:hypothetical protein
MSSASTAEKVLPDAYKDPGLGISLNVDLGAGRVCTLQTYVPSECTPVTLNKMLDKMTAAGDRQRAHYRIEELVREVEHLTREFSDHRDDMATVERNYEADCATLKQQAQDAATSVVTTEVLAKEAWQRSGKRGEFKLDAGKTSRIAQINGGIEKIKEALRVKAVERDNAQAQYAILQGKRTARLEKLNAELQECRDKVAAGLQSEAHTSTYPHQHLGAGHGGDDDGGGDCIDRLSDCQSPRLDRSGRQTAQFHSVGPVPDL